MNFEKSLNDVNDKIGSILCSLWEIAHQLPVKNIFSIYPDPAHPLYDAVLDALDEMEPLLKVSRVGSACEISLEWLNAFYPNLTGLVFAKQVVGRRDLQYGHEFVSMQAKLVEGPGRRVLFRALGAKSVTINLRPKASLREWVQGEDSEIIAGFEVESCELQLFDESAAGLRHLSMALDEAEKSIARKMTLALIAGDYLPFRDWAAWDLESGEVDLPASAKFRQLFHQ